jgi:hypothetical protein
MRRRLLLFLACLFVVLAAGVHALLLTAPTDRINSQTFEIIHLRMTNEEVEAIVGGPEGIYAPAPKRDGAALVTDIYVNNCFMVFGPVVPRRWQGERGMLVVVFNERGRVVEKVFVPWEGEEPLLAKLHRWLGLG